MTKSRDLADNAQNTKPKVVDAKGDLLVGTGSDAADRLAVSDDGSTLVANSAESTGLAWAGNYAAGKNAIINGDFRINQRNFTSSASYGYGFDRWLNSLGGGTGTATFSAETFTLGSAPVAGYEGTNFLRCVTTGQSAAGTFSIFQQQIESVTTFANRTVTVSFWARAGSGTPKLFVELDQYFGTGGSAGVRLGSQVTLSTSWNRYSVTVNLASIAGKTLGTNNALGLLIWCSAGTNFDARTNSLGIQSNTFDLWGVQVEAGNVSTSFQTATGTIQGELAACQRYYFRLISDGSGDRFGVGMSTLSTASAILTTFPVAMRTPPTALEQTGTASDYTVPEGGNNTTCSAVPAFNTATNYNATTTFTVASGLNAGYASYGRAAGANVYLGWSAEL